MKSFTTFLLFISSFLSCTSTDKNKEKIVTFEDLLNTDSIARVDSMKWYYYAMNAKGRALFYDTIKQLGDTADPLECDAELTGFMQRNKDTSFYIFSFKK